MPFEAPLASGHLPGDFDVDLNTTPSFITKPTFFSSLTSARGSPATAITSAYAPGATTPSSPLRPSSSAPREVRSEEHTSELQSHLNLVCRLLLEKKKKSLTAPQHTALRNTHPQ